MTKLQTIPAPLAFAALHTAPLEQRHEDASGNHDLPPLTAGLFDALFHLNERRLRQKDQQNQNASPVAVFTCK